MFARNRNLLILSFSLIVVMLGFGMVIPIFPFYVAQLGAGGSALGLLVATAALTELIFGPVWGSVSDRTGRKPILMIGVLGYGLSLLFFGLATELWMLFAARALSGILSSATLSTSMAFIGDSTTREERGGGMGAIGAAAGLGIILGPGLGGWLAGDSLSTPFFIGAALSLVSVLLIALLLPETLPREARAQVKISKSPLAASFDSGPRFFDFTAFRSECAVLRSGCAGILRNLGNWRGLRQALSKGSPIRFLLFLAFFVTFGTANFEAIFGLFMLDKHGYGPEQVGAILTVVGFVALIGRGLLTGAVTKWWGEPNVILISLLAGSLGFVLLLLAQSFTVVLITTGFFVLTTTFLRPSIHSLTSQRATVGQGAAMGLSNSAVSLGRVIGPLWAGAVFDLNPDYPYASGALILLSGFLLCAAWLRRGPQTATQPASTSSPPESAPVSHRMAR
jgi:DHA1 family multidrug resistance protein-like MFS transporter